VAVCIYDYSSRNALEEDAGVKMKNKSGFIVQPEGFDLSKCCISPADYGSNLVNYHLQKRQYQKLVGAIYHNGSTSCGHYKALVDTGEVLFTTLTEARKPSYFIEIDDAKVARAKVTAEDISRSDSRFCKNCYILFYE